jgi:small subunit ribosomal protein S9
MEVINTIGRRKKSVARLYVSKGKGAFVINKRDLETYFPSQILQNKIKEPFTLTEMDAAGFDLKVNVSGGGVTGQAEAIRLAIARALVEYDQELKPALKAESLMTRDPRMVERKKFGQKKARKKFQFSKR